MKALFWLHHSASNWAGHLRTTGVSAETRVRKSSYKATTKGSEKMKGAVHP